MPASGHLRTPTAVRFTPRHLELIEQRAIEKKLPKNQVIRMAIDHYFAESGANTAA
jgi:hypothetical protein